MQNDFKRINDFSIFQSAFSCSVVTPPRAHNSFTNLKKNCNSFEIFSPCSVETCLNKNNFFFDVSPTASIHPLLHACRAMLNLRRAPSVGVI
jgi:hypothetical protein